MKILRVFSTLVLGWTSKKTTTTTNDVDDDTTKIQLTKLEHTLLTMVPPTTTITWFEGNHEEAATIIKDRMDDILSQNPWLSGKFEKIKDKEHLSFCTSRRFHDVDNDIFIRFQHKDSPLHANMQYDDLVREVTAANSDKQMALSMKKFRKQPFWKVSLIPCSQNPDTRFAMCVSLSHGVGDGYCFYSLHNMLMGGSPIKVMTPERISTSVQQQEEVMGKAEANYGHSLGVVLSVLRGMLSGLLGLKRNQVGQTILSVDVVKLKELKENETKKSNQLSAAAEVDVPFISSNDVMTSWFMANTESKHGMMAVNLRGKLDGHTQDHSFNAENDMYYRCPDDVSNPSLIRKSLLTMKRAATINKPFNHWQLVFGDVCFITNMFGFAKHANNNLYGRQLVHLPIYDLKSMCPPNYATLVIFQPRPNEMAVLVGGTTKKIDLISKMPFGAKNPFEFIPLAS